MSRKIKIFSVVLALGLIAESAAVLHLNHQQGVAYQAAEAYADRMWPIISADARFKDVVVYRFSGYGCARYRGTVKNQEDLTALQNIIAQSEPPKGVQIIQSVIVGPPNPAATEGLR